jgi:predicted Rossmann fold nucleotide-binding protein DprA/Smf involved in DNA uptake
MRHCANSLQLETAANATWLLERNGEDVRIDLRGRGQFANQTLHARSANVGNYELIDHHSYQVPRLDAADLILATLQDQTLTAKEVSIETDLNLGTVRNTLAKLRFQGLITTVEKKNRQPIYTILRS